MENVYKFIVCTVTSNTKVCQYYVCLIYAFVLPNKQLFVQEIWVIDK